MARPGLFALLLLTVACGSSLHEDRHAFLVAAESGDTQVVKEQLGAGVEPDDVFNIGDKTALRLAALNARVEVVKALLAAGADPTFQRQGATIQVEVRGFQKVLAEMQANPDLKGEYLKQDGTKVDLRSFAPHEAEYTEVLKLIDEAAAHWGKK